MIRQSYDIDAGALYITVTDGKVARSDEIDSGTLVDLDSTGSVVGIEVINPGRAWPIRQIIDEYGISEGDAAQLLAYFPGTAQFAPPQHPEPAVPSRVLENA
jgi:uncharacterized protein YuzE